MCERLDEVYHWFNISLRVPPYSSCPWPEDTACWFRDCAREPIRRAWEIAGLLEEEGVPVRMLRSHNPGRVLYEDEYQVVVFEWGAFRRDLMRALRGCRAVRRQSY